MSYLSIEFFWLKKVPHFDFKTAALSDLKELRPNYQTGSESP